MSKRFTNEEASTTADYRRRKRNRIKIEDQEQRLGEHRIKRCTMKKYCVNSKGPR